MTNAARRCAAFGVLISLAAVPALIEARAAVPEPRYELRMLASAVEFEGKYEKKLSHPVFSPDGSLIMYGKAAGEIVQRKAGDLTVVRIMASGIRYLHHVEWMEDQRILASGYQTKILSPEYVVEEDWSAAGFTHPGGYFQRAGRILSACYTGSTGTGGVRHTHVQLRNLQGESLGYRKFGVEAIAGWLSPNGRHYVAKMLGDRMVLGLRKSFVTLTSFKVPGLETVREVDFSSGTWPLSDLVFTPDGTRFVVQMRDPDSLALYAFPSLERIGTLPYPDYAPRSFSPDGRLLAISVILPEKPDGFKILDTRDWSVVAEVRAMSAASARFSADGRKLVTISASPDSGEAGPSWGKRLIRVWELAERSESDDPYESAGACLSKLYARFGPRKVGAMQCVNACPPGTRPSKPGSFPAEGDRICEP